MTPFIKDSRESNSNLEEHKDNLENHDVSDSKHFPFSSNIMLCDCVSNRESGLKIHTTRKHPTIEQLDGSLEDFQIKNNHVFKLKHSHCSKQLTSLF